MVNGICVITLNSVKHKIPINLTSLLTGILSFVAGTRLSSCSRDLSRRPTDASILSTYPRDRIRLILPDDGLAETNTLRRKFRLCPSSFHGKSCTSVCGRPPSSSLHKNSVCLMSAWLRLAASKRSRCLLEGTGLRSKQVSIHRKPRL